MKIIVNVTSGLCNRLIPYITGLRLSKKLNAEYLVYWDEHCGDIDYKYSGIKTQYNDMFKNIEGVTFINNEKLNKYINNNNYKILKINYLQKYKNKLKDLTKYDIIYFNHYVHPISTDVDNITFTYYTEFTETYLINDNLYINEIQKTFELLKPIDIIQDKINEVYSKFNDNTIGIHLRHWPDNFKPNYKELFEDNEQIRVNIMNEMIKRNNNITFFISTTDLNELTNLINIFGKRIIYFINRIGDDFEDGFYSEERSKSNTNKNNNLNGVVDLYLLSKCKLIIGDVGSSFSTNSYLLNSNKKTYIPLKKYIPLTVNFNSDGRLQINDFENPWNIRDLWCSYLSIEFIKSQLGNSINNIIEFGSYDGGDGIKYKYHFPLANVYSIEPSPCCFKNTKLLEKYGLNVFNYAISNQNSVMDFYETIDSIKNNKAPCGSLNKEYISTTTGNKPLEITEPIKIKTITLKQFCEDNKIHNIDLLHVDVEGYSCEVIDGMDDLKPRMIYIEVMNETHNHSDKISILLLKKGYKKLYALGADEVWIYNNN